MNKKIRGTLFIIFGCISWGFSGACGQFLFDEKDFSPLLLTAIRMIFAGLMLISICFFKEKDKLKQIVKEPKDILRITMFGLAGVAFSQVSYLLSIKYTNAGIATALQCTSPVMIMLYVCLVSKKLPKISEAISVVAAVVGAFAISTGLQFDGMSIHPLGLFWGIMCGVSMLIYTVMPQKMLAKWGSMLVSGFGMLCGGIVYAILIQAWSIPAQYDLSTVAAVASMVVFGTVIAYTAYLQGVNDVGPLAASVLGSAEPVAATVFAAIWLGTSFNFGEIAGLILIISTVFILAWGDREK